VRAHSAQPGLLAGFKEWAQESEKRKKKNKGRKGREEGKEQGREVERNERRKGGSTSPIFETWLCPWFRGSDATKFEPSKVRRFCQHSKVLDFRTFVVIFSLTHH